MSWLFIAVVFGAVEGLTEFIPVSSTGHLILTSALLGLDDENIKTFEVFIQLGAILAVVVIYRERFLALLRATSVVQAAHGDTPLSTSTLTPSTRPFTGMDGIFKLIVATIPALVAGFLLSGLIKRHLFSSVTVLWALVVGGVIMILVERLYGKRYAEAAARTGQKRSLEELTIVDCFKAGLFQCVALWPGMSRSGSTIVGGLLLGFERRLATELSFLMAVPTMCAACLYDLLKSFNQLHVEDFATFALGFVVAFVVGILAIKFFLAVLRTYNLVPFAVYRILIGLVGLALL